MEDLIIQESAEAFNKYIQNTLISAKDYQQKKKSLN